ncbi:MAG: hypothetical protein GFH27_549303n219 [Chloroflexi bacterium AL-W]|nr:hypothetical protein [Chloroflexi bacterium AL-N1]NOK68104.1 hypothetical protein [Chloroflexi bacterium AL-N10]NOK73444.1 hypothetical protein [Chloroflexi bacterium AL-N5]NOK83358.1 hypothetical protein [Chloroflexi bacterium AL-W]NOK87775.1 hypothetical protein [Chloroflexi bacterium AL-N15]
MIKGLHQLNIISDMAYIAVIASIMLSIVAWFTRREDNLDQAERLGVFFELWAPTLAILGRPLEDQKRTIQMQSD